MNSQFNGDFSMIGSEKFITYLIVLNTHVNMVLLNDVVKSSQKIILADGGANRFYQIRKDCSIIDWVVGDFDSINPNILQYYKEQGVKVQHFDDQDSTDLDKALSKIDIGSYPGVICVLGGDGDRLDHNFGVFNSVTKAGRSLINFQIFIINNSGFMFYLKPQKQYRIKLSNLQSKKSCGVITFNKVKQITTKGLKWDMGKNQYVSSLQFGGILSTSNQIVGQQVEIKVSDQAFWITHLNKFEQ